MASSSSSSSSAQPYPPSAPTAPLVPVDSDPPNGPDNNSPDGPDAPPSGCWGTINGVDGPDNPGNSPDATSDAPIRLKSGNTSSKKANRAPHKQRRGPKNPSLSRRNSTIAGFPRASSPRGSNGVVLVGAASGGGIGSGGFGQPINNTGLYGNTVTRPGQGVQGNSFFNAQVPYLSYRLPSPGTNPNQGQICCILDGDINNAIWFQYSSGNYVPMVYTKHTLILDGTLFRVLDPEGNQYFFYDFVAATGPIRGLLVEYQDPFGHAAYPSLCQRPVDFLRSADSGSDNDGFYYSYYTSGANTGLLQSVTHKVDSANVQQAVYTYYGSGDPNGNVGDLESVVTQEWDGVSAWDDTGTTYYRYWLGTEPTGVKHGLKYLVGPRAYALMVTAGITPETATNTQVADYADEYYEYDPTTRQVTKEIVNAGTQTYTYAYATSSFTNDNNQWQTKTTVGLPNGASNIVYSNYVGQTMLSVYQSGSDVWCTYYQYDSSGNVILQAQPSAVVSYDDTHANLNVTLNSASGLIYTYQFYTSTGGGGVAGYMQYEQVQEGSGGTADILREYQYTSQTVGTATVYRRSKVICYPDAADHTININCVIYTYVWYSGTFQVQQLTTTWPEVDTTQNGSGSSNNQNQYFDEYGQVTWIRDERGFLTNFTWDLSTGGLVQRIDDVDTTLVTPPSGTGWTTPAGGGLNLTTDYTIDQLGRMTQELGPQHTVDIGGTATSIRRARWMVYFDTTQMTYEGVGYATGTSSYTYTLINPVKVTQYDNGGNVVDEQMATRSSTSGPLSPSDTFPQSTWVRWHHYDYDNSGLLTDEREYFLIPATGNGSSGTNYNETDYGYDVMRSPLRRQTPGGTITRAVYDDRERMIGNWVGTNDTGATPSNPAGSGSPNNMVQVAAYQYDGGSAGGDDNLTQQTLYDGLGGSRVTTYGYDFRDRRITVDGEINLYLEYSYDNLGRVTQVDQYDTTGSGPLVASTQINYDNAGRIFQRLVFSVTSGTAGNSLIETMWYDPSGNLMKHVPLGTQVFEKMQYDGLNHQTARYLCYNTSEADTDYSAAGSITGDTVLKQVETSYDEASNVIQLTNRDRFHNATGTGALTAPGGSQPQARVSYQALYPDPIGRLQAAANYGTNAASSFTRSSTIPTGSATILVSSIAYDANTGDPVTLTDPAGTVTNRTFDDAGRLTIQLENYVSGGSGADQNQETDFVYNADSRLSTLTAVNSVTGNQVTTWIYGTTLTDSGVASNDLVRTKQFPDNVSGSDQVQYAYNALGQVTQINDQLGTVRELIYDALGRLQHDCVNTLGSGLDSTILRITRYYEVRGMITSLNSYNNATPGSGLAVNTVVYTYNGFGQLATESQWHGSMIDPAYAPVVQYGYADGSSGYARRTSITHPDGTVISYGYGTAGGASDVLNRVEQITDGSTVVANYSFLGASIPVISQYPEPGIVQTYYTSGGSGDAGDQYTGLDRFGRIVDQRWDLSGTDLERLQYGYDQANNRLWRDNTVADVASANQDEFYTYDGLYQLKSLDRGTLNSGKTGIVGTPTWEEDWNFDPSGNWYGSSTAYVTKVSGTTTLSQNRTHNTANKITGISNTAAPAWSVPAYDAAGNMTSGPYPANAALTCAYQYDAWYRLTKLSIFGASTAVHAYDGANRRIYKTAGGYTRHYYYSDSWQSLEERIGSSSTADRHFVWGIKSVDDLILRDDATPLRLYALSDSLSITAVVDSSGTVQERYGYNGFGTVRYMDGSFGSRTGSSYDWETLFAGYRYDTASRIYQVRFRYYHTLLGRWINRDPIGEMAGTHLYAYVANMPTKFIDLFGLDDGTNSPSSTNAPILNFPPLDTKSNKCTDDVHMYFKCAKFV